MRCQGELGGGIGEWSWRCMAFLAWRGTARHRQDTWIGSAAHRICAWEPLEGLLAPQQLLESSPHRCHGAVAGLQNVRRSQIQPCTGPEGRCKESGCRRRSQESLSAPSGYWHHLPSVAADCAVTAQHSRTCLVKAARHAARLVQLALPLCGMSPSAVVVVCNSRSLHGTHLTTTHTYCLCTIGLCSCSHRSYRPCSHWR